MRNIIKLFLIFTLTSITNMLSAQQIFTLKGKVTSFEGKPLNNVNVSIFGKNFKGWFAAITDSLGNYSLPTVYNGDTLYFTASGIMSKKEIIEGNTYILTRVPLLTDHKQGVVIEAKVDSFKRYNPQQRKNQMAHNYAIKPKPINGWNDFDKLISKELKYPQAAIENQTQGIVVVGLSVTNTGDVKELKIVKGIGSGCDDEVLRIIKLYPKWMPGIENGYPIGGEVEYAVTFKLKER
jgi:TonB family protein